MSSLTTKDVSFRVIDLNTKIERYLKKYKKNVPTKLFLGNIIAMILTRIWIIIYVQIVGKGTLLLKSEDGI